MNRTWRKRVCPKGHRRTFRRSWHACRCREMFEGWRNEANCSESEQTIHRQTGLGCGRTGTASRSKAMVATQSWCRSARRAPSDAHSGTRRIASCGPDCQFILRVSSASGTDGVMTRPFYTTEEAKTSLPLDFSLDGALRKTSWLADRAFGVVTTRLGLAVRVTPDFEEVVRLVQPENHNKFL